MFSMVLKDQAMQNASEDQERVDFTMPISHLETIIHSQIVEKEKVQNLLKVNDPEIIQVKQSEPPKIKVTLFRVEKGFEGTMPLDGLTENQYRLNPIKVCYLWDLAKFEKVDLLRCGRFRKNDFHPIIQEDPLEMDLKVSREHALMGLYKDKIYFIDYGTSSKYKKRESQIPKEAPEFVHTGSKNGSWIYHNLTLSACIRNRCVAWEQEALIGVGGFLYDIQCKENIVKLFHQFCFAWEEA